MNDTIIDISKEEDGYDANVLVPFNIQKTENGILNSAEFIGTFNTRPKAIAAAIEFCKSKGWNPLEIIE